MWRKNVSVRGHFKGVGHIGEGQREGELVATALSLNITSLPAHSAQFGNGVEGKMTCEEGKREVESGYITVSIVSGREHGGSVVHHVL